ncbi:MAG TPA: hypothetical protein VEX60_02910 [Pyrinomonadaceae bacterium]|nr:hypothetical protein [Pyrinomonadaceae bacterium]
MRNAGYFILGLLVQLPSILTALVCIIIAAVRWKRHPRISLLLILSLSWITVQSLIFDAIFFFAPQWLIDQGKTSSLDTFYTVTGVTYNVMAALALALLLVAVFSLRMPSQRTV